MTAKQKKSDTLDRILDSAESLFARQGFEGTSTRQIAQAAGISIQTLHYHCENKTNLYLMVIRRAVVPMVERLNGHTARLIQSTQPWGGAVDAVMDAAIEDLFDLLHANPNYALLYFRQYMEPNPDLMQVEFESYVPALRQWAEAGAALFQTRVGPALDMPLALLSIAWTAHGLFVNSHFVGALLETDPKSPEHLERLKRFAKTMAGMFLGRFK